MEKKKEYERQYYQKHKEKMLAYKKQYYKKYRNKKLAHQKQWNETHRDEMSTYYKQWYERNRDKILAWYEQNKEKRRQQVKTWQKNHREQYHEIVRRRNSKRQRELGFIPLNEWFKGSEAHHIGKERVIYIPKEIHQSIRHNVWTGRNMVLINALAFDYLLETKVSEAQGNE